MLNSQEQIIRHAIETEAKTYHHFNTCFDNGIIQWDHYFYEEHADRIFKLVREDRGGQMVHVLVVTNRTFQKKGSSLGPSRVVSEHTAKVLLKGVKAFLGWNIDSTMSDIYSMGEIKQIKAGLLHHVKEDLLKYRQEQYIAKIMGKVA